MFDRDDLAAEGPGREEEKIREHLRIGKRLKNLWRIAEMKMNLELSRRAAPKEN